MLREAGYYVRMALGVYRLLRSPRLADPELLLREQMAQRESRWLDTIRRAVFANEQHPYCQMFRVAGCGYEDLQNAVQRKGLEGALTQLHRAGVYLTHDEFKGKTPIVRAGREIASDERSFSNPLVKGLLEGRSSGSRSRRTRSQTSSDFLLYREAYWSLLAREHGWEHGARAVSMSILPDAVAFTRCLLWAHVGKPIQRWFTVSGGWKEAGHYRMVTRALVAWGRLLGAQMPFPTELPPNDFTPVARWLAEQRARGNECMLYTLVSPGARIAAAAQDGGLDIRGTHFVVTGEALTEAKRAVMEGAGGRVSPIYGSTEVGPAGFACRHMQTGNSVHVLRDAVAITSYRRMAPLAEVEVDSLLVTTLLPMAPILLINTEMDDAGVVEKADCHCLFQAAGMTERIRDIFSFGKLTGQGMTLVGSNIVRILEEALPQRLGGRPGDYQLVEREGKNQTQLTLRVSPRVGSLAAEAVRSCFLQEVRQYQGGAVAAQIWRHADAVEVELAEPYTTSTGKVMPLHLLGPGGAQG